MLKELKKKRRDNIFLLPSEDGTRNINSEQHMYRNVKQLQISMHPTSEVHISVKEEERPKGQDDSQLAEGEEGKEEEQTLNDLVGALQDMIKDVPTKAHIPLPTAPLPTAPLLTEPPVVMTTVLESPQSETVDTFWVSLSPTPEEEEAETAQVEPTESVILATQINPASPVSIWEVQNSTSELVVLHTPETTTLKPRVSVSLFLEKATTKKRIKTFDQMTNGALSNLEESLENVKKLNGVLHTFTKTPVHQESENGKEQNKKPTPEDILGLIEKLIEILKSTPSFVKEDRNLYKYIQTAETYIKEALELVRKAEQKLQQDNVVLLSTPASAREKKTPSVPIPEPLPMPAEIVQSISLPPMPLAEKTEDVQVEMGKLNAFINMLYGFSPHLTTYTQNAANRQVAEDIVERALAVLQAIKDVFCGSEEAQSKRALKQLLKEDMELVNQAVKAKRAS